MIQFSTDQYIESLFCFKDLLHNKTSPNTDIKIDKSDKLAKDAVNKNREWAQMK